MLQSLQQGLIEGEGIDIFKRLALPCFQKAGSEAIRSRPVRHGKSMPVHFDPGEERQHEGRGGFPAIENL